MIHGDEREGCPAVLALSNENKQNLGHAGKEELICRCYISDSNLLTWSFSFDSVQFACDYISDGSCNESGSPWLFLFIMCPYLWQITEHDEPPPEIFEGLQVDDNKGFLLEFYFITNPYNFKNPMVFRYLFNVKTIEVQTASLHWVTYKCVFGIWVNRFSSAGSFSLTLDLNQECSVIVWLSFSRY